MGWWSIADSKTLFWGDRPADIMDNALDGIVENFEAALGRKPKKTELLYGLRTSWGSIFDKSS